MNDFAQYLKNLPIMPDIAAKVLNMAGEGKDFDFSDLEDVIKVDPGLTAKVLKVANSSMYARQGEISNLQTAISMLGFKNIRNLVVLITASALFKADAESEFLMDFWKHELVSAFASNYLADRVNRTAVKEEAFLAALIHNVGEIAFYNADPQGYEYLYRQSHTTGEDLRKLESGRFNTDHSQVGSAILESWHFPEVYRDVAREYGRKNITSSHKLLVILVSIGDFMAWNLMHEEQRPIDEIRHYLPFIGLTTGGLERLISSVEEGLESDRLYQEIGRLFGII